MTPGTIVGSDFRVQKVLGEGGMGTVYLAEQLSTGAPRALKVMHPGLVARPKLRERFEQEARVGARIPSDHIVQVIAAGIDPTEGFPWLAMEFLKGADLDQTVTQHGAPPFEQAKLILRQVCHALSAAHQQGIVHRDLKPENIFLAQPQRSDATWEVKLLDFGIAKVVSDANYSATAAVGTPMWMAPEQTQQSAAVRPHTDVWSLGLIAFWLFTGAHYWHAANDPDAPLQHLLRELLVDDLVPSSQRADESGSAARLPAEFDTWFARCVQRDPTARFPDAAAAWQALERLLDRPPDAAAEPRPAMDDKARRRAALIAATRESDEQEERSAIWRSAQLIESSQPAGVNPFPASVDAPSRLSPLPGSSPRLSPVPGSAARHSPLPASGQADSAPLEPTRLHVRDAPAAYEATRLHVQPASSAHHRPAQAPHQQPPFGPPPPQGGSPGGAYYPAPPGYPVGHGEYADERSERRGGFGCFAWGFLFTLFAIGVAGVFVWFETDWLRTADVAPTPLRSDPAPVRTTAATPLQTAPPPTKKPPPTTLFDDLFKDGDTGLLTVTCSQCDSVHTVPSPVKAAGSSTKHLFWLKPGSYEVIAKRRGYQTQTRKIRVVRGGLSLMFTKWEKVTAPRGTLAINCVPACTAYLVDHRRHKTPSPAKIRLSPGRYTVTGERHGKRSKSKTVTVYSNKVSVALFRM